MYNKKLSISYFKHLFNCKIVLYIQLRGAVRTPTTTTRPHTRALANHPRNAAVQKSIDNVLSSISALCRSGRWRFSKERV